VKVVDTEEAPFDKHFSLGLFKAVLSGRNSRRRCVTRYPKVIKLNRTNEAEEAVLSGRNSKRRCVTRSPKVVEAKVDKSSLTSKYYHSIE
jgi:hypothetical protein